MINKLHEVLHYQLFLQGFLLRDAFRFPLKWQQSFLEPGKLLAVSEYEKDFSNGKSQSDQ